MSVNGELLWHTTWCVLVCGLVTLVAFRWSLEYGVLYGILLLFIGYILFRSGHTLGADDEFRDSEPSRETGSAVQESSATRAINQEERRPPPDKDHLLKLLQQGVIRRLSPQDQALVEFDNQHGWAVESACTICLANYEHGDKIATSGCRHVFHEDCILEWLVLSKECPCCRQGYVDWEAGEAVP